jgi:alpha-N-acetylglucosamine transferase
LHSDDFLPGTQTLLYSLKKKLSLSQRYPPEIVVLVTPNVDADKVRSTLCPALCTRVLPVDDWPAPVKSIDSKLSKTKEIQRTLDEHSPGWTKLQIFGLQQYDTIVYLDSDCLVIKDISQLLALNKVYTESEALIAAAPDLLPPHHFSSGVMVVRPSTKVVETMKQHSTLLTTFDRSDTGFLNAFYPDWYTDMAPSTRLPVGYNAQQAMFDWTSSTTTTTASSSDDGKNIYSNFWDVQISGELYVVHYSNPIKPWQPDTTSSSSSSTSSLVILWKDWHRKSKTFLARYHKEAQAKADHQEEQRQQQQDAATRKRQATAAARPPAAAKRANPHKAIQKRFKELRAQGKSTQDAMQQARKELLSEDELQEADASKQVAAMFGMM